MLPSDDSVWNDTLRHEKRRMRLFFLKISPKNQREAQICKRIRVNGGATTHKKKRRSRNEDECGVNDALRIKKKTHASKKRNKSIFVNAKV